MLNGRLQAATVALLAGLSLPAATAAESAPDYSTTTLSGDWSGARSALWQRGLALEAGLKLDSLHNRGALSSGSKTVSHIDLKLGIDLDKAAGWTGGSALINVVSDSGWGPNIRHVGGQMGVSSIEVGVPGTTRLFQAWLQQSLLDDTLAVLAGLYPIDSEFFTMDSAGVFLGPQYGTPADLALTNAPSVFNNSAFGIRARWTIAPALYVMAAVLDGIPNDPARPKRTAIRFAKGDGSFSIGELGWLPEADNDKFNGHAKLALGLWGYSAKANDLRDLDGNGDPMLRSRRGGYLLGERTLLRLGGSDDRFSTGFARYTFSDGDSTALRNTLNLGLNLKGPADSRPDDVIGLAWTRGGISQKWRDVQALPADTRSSEDVLEITYRYAVTPYLAIQPNYQHVRNPGGTAAPSANLLGVRIDIAL